MLKFSFNDLFSIFIYVIESPKRSLQVSTCLFLIAIMVDMTPYWLIRLHRDHQQLKERVLQLNNETRQNAIQILEMQKPQAIERLLRKNYRYIRDGDMVFIFEET